jgi:DNA-binding winged helix-turn-helix (wHTH) protein
MIEVSLPENYFSIEKLHGWLRENFSQKDYNRWSIITYPGRGYVIRFNNDNDALMFNLKWDHNENEHLV